MFALWAAILSANRRAKLLIGFMTDTGMTERFREALIKYGALPEQLIFRERTDMESYLAMHHEVDMLLNAFPYSGGTTTCHAACLDGGADTDACRRNARLTSGV